MRIWQYLIEDRRNSYVFTVQKDLDDTYMTAIDYWFSGQPEIGEVNLASEDRMIYNQED